MASITRKELLQLATLAAIGWGVGAALKWYAPVGRDVSGNAMAQRALRDSVSPARGSADADVTMVVFTDYQCPACKLGAPAMEKALSADGRVRTVYRDWPIFGPASYRAARIAIAAGRQGVYHKVHTHLMAVRTPLDDNVLREAVEASGGDWRGIMTTLARDGDAIDRQLVGNQRDALALGLSGTPSYLVGSSLIEGAMDEHAFARAFRAARSD